MRPIQLLVRLPHSHIDPSRLFAMEFENGNQPRAGGCAATEAIATVEQGIRNHERGSASRTPPQIEKFTVTPLARV